MRFLVDGKAVLTEETMPFGDIAGFWTSKSVANGRHTFEVRALNDAGTVLATNTVSASVDEHDRHPPRDTTAPSTPSNLRVASATATSVTIAWNAATDNVGVAGYGLYRGSSQTGQTQQTTATVQRPDVRHRLPGRRRRLRRRRQRVAAGDDVGHDLRRAPTHSRPPRPTNVTASTRTTTSIALTWAPATDNVGVAGYGVYNGANLVDTTAGTTGIVSGLTCGTNYTLAVDAFDASGNSSPKTTVMVSTLPCTDTTAPTATMTSPANGSKVTGTINAAANATDNVGVTRVEFFRDGVSIGSDTTSPYSIAFNTATIATAATRSAPAPTTRPGTSATQPT